MIVFNQFKFRFKIENDFVQNLYQSKKLNEWNIILFILTNTSAFTDIGTNVRFHMIQGIKLKSNQSKHLRSE